MLLHLGEQVGMDILKEKRFQGTLLGLACGDAVGATVEFCPRDRFEPLTDMIGGGKFQLNPGEWTDDTAMALCLADSLIEKGFDLKDQMDRYWRWANEGYNSCRTYPFGMGKQVSQALIQYKKRGEPLAGKTDSKFSGNGSLMRLAPVVIYSNSCIDECFRYAGLSSKTTHGSIECVSACRFLAAAIFFAFEGFNKEEMLDSALSKVQFPESMSCIERREFLTKSRENIVGSGYVVESLEAALWAFYSTESFESAVLEAANLGDDADTTAAICGQIAGAYYGVDSIPSHWLTRLYRADDMSELAIRLASS
jgi:ADP-ribosyl-[dinitrogen reductase] hydrolase